MSPLLAEPVDASRAMTVSDLERLAGEHGRRLRNFIRRRIGNAADVDDLMQETFLEALRCLAHFKGTSRPETWLFGIALNLVRGHYKRATMRRRYEEDPGDTAMDENTAEDPIETVGRMQEINRLCEAVERLPSTSLSVLTLVFDEHLTYEETACRLHIPIGTVRSRIARARAALRSGERHTLGALQP